MGVEGGAEWRRARVDNGLGAGQELLPRCRRRVRQAGCSSQTGMPAHADHVEQEKIVRDSGLDWTLVRPGAYTDGERTGDYRHGFPASATGLKLKIARADVADFMLNQLGDDSYLRMAPGISY